MKRIWKVFKMLTLVFLVLFLLFVTTIAIFVNTAPQFGAIPEGADLEKISVSSHFKDGIFVNLVETKMDMGFKNILKTFYEFSTVSKQSPSKPIPVMFGENDTPLTDTTAHLTWYGHSAFLLEIEGKRILLDPMFGPSSSPVGFMTIRYPYEKPIDLNEFTNIDALVLSHDHYDHLDYGSILALDPHVKHYYVPLGVGSHLRFWGVAPDKITELDWHDHAQHGHLTFTATPARHFSGRGITDRNTTLWASWVITGKHNNIYFSGDGGYADHFKAIGAKYGPFDIALMECGQYNEKWASIHMMPEQTAQAGVDVKAKTLVPIHWGAFDLALHHWDEPVIRVTAAAQKLGLPVATPLIGERFQVGKDLPQTKWWVGL